MKSSRGRQSFNVALVAGAMVFGMVIAGGMDLTPIVSADSSVASGNAVTVASTPAGLPSFADLAEGVSSAVVSVQATKIEEASARQRRNDPFDLFFGPRRQQPEEPRDRRSDAAGSGFVISSDGYVVTNHHVIEDATELTVTLDGQEYKAEVKGDDPATDLALLKIEPEAPLDYLRLADSDEVRVGDWIMVIGSPLQLRNSVSVGVVSAKGRSIDITPDRSLENFIQTDAAINFGNSGGPLVDLSGAVVGIATAINFGAENIGFAVPSNTLKGILPQLRDSGAVRRGYLGVNIDDLDREEAEAFGLTSTDGALVTQVISGGPAEQAGLRHGDVILEVEGRKVVSNRDLIDRISSKMPSESVKVKVFRAGKKLDKEVVLGERPSAPGVVAITPDREESGSIEWLGIRYRDLTPDARDAHRIPDLQGVWIADVAPTSPLWEEAVRPGDIIVDVGGQPVKSVAEFEEMVSAVPSGGLLRLYVTRINPRDGSAASFFAIVRVP